MIRDALHTWLGGGLPTETERLLGNRPAYLQVKDVASREDQAPPPLGARLLPIRECVALERELAPNGWVSWEYERAWHPESPALAEIGEAGHRWVSAALAQSATQ